MGEIVIDLRKDSDKDDWERVYNKVVVALSDDPDALVISGFDDRAGWLNGTILGVK